MIEGPPETFCTMHPIRYARGLFASSPILVQSRCGSPHEASAGRDLEKRPGTAEQKRAWNERPTHSAHLVFTSFQRYLLCEHDIPYRQGASWYEAQTHSGSPPSVDFTHVLRCSSVDSITPSRIASEHFKVAFSGELDRKSVV